ncbi:hypothetical protein [Robertkochia solimangrovi]|nr:hypothetical protein [Robertkochia solimangrovi]
MKIFIFLFPSLFSAIDTILAGETSTVVNDFEITINEPGVWFINFR